MRGLYPALEPYRCHDVPRGQGHRLHVEECGRPDGVPVLFLHGGPGSGCAPGHRRFFDPAYYRIVLLDQRGSGRSVPLGETGANRTDLLIEDLEVIRAALGIERWALFGGSWGATLALLYAQRFPGRVSAMVLRGTFLARERDLAWFFGPDGAARLFPEQWAAFSAGARAASWRELITDFHERARAADPAVVARAVQQWSDWGGHLVTAAALGPGGVAQAADRHPPDLDETGLAKVLIETHYAQHGYFLGGAGLLDRAADLPEVPVTLAHGRWDLVCPLESAWALHRAVPDSRLIVVPEAGHLIWDPAMVDALVGETDRLRALLG